MRGDEAYMIARRNRTPTAPECTGRTTFAFRIDGPEDRRDGMGAVLCGGHWSISLEHGPSTIAMDGGAECDSAVGTYGTLGPEDVVRDLAGAVRELGVLLTGQVRTPAGVSDVRIDGREAFCGTSRARWVWDTSEGCDVSQKGGKRAIRGFRGISGGTGTVRRAVAVRSPCRDRAGIVGFRAFQRR